MSIIQEPLYDEDLVNLGYLKKVVNQKDEEEVRVPRNYGSPPSPPYYLNETYTTDNSIFKCINERLTGNFTQSDWKKIATDDTTFNSFIGTRYGTDEIEITEQADAKIESFYQTNDPSENWDTDLEKSYHVGDYWYNKTNNNQYRYDKKLTNPITYEWTAINVPISIYDTIDGHKNIFTEKPTEYNIDDLWIIEETTIDNDMPIGTEENSISRGDWVFTLKNNTSYDKNDWQKLNEEIKSSYTEERTYTFYEINKKFSEIERLATASINKTKDNIELKVAQEYTTKEEYTDNTGILIEQALKTIQSTILEQTSRDFTMWFQQTGLQGTVDDLQNALATNQTKLNKYSEYIKFEGAKIILGKSNSPYRIIIQNDEIAFMAGDDKCAYISQNKLYINQIVVVNQFQRGNFLDVVDDETKNLNLFWAGD